MKKILSLIEKKKKDLSNHVFCQWLERADKDKDLLAFTPSMSYFVLGFRDILELVKYLEPKTELEKAINHHCDEDSEHWKWFLKDLQTMGYLNVSTYDFLSQIWSDDERTPRNMIYFLTHLVQTQKNPALVLVVVECLEAAFAVFIEKLRPQLIERNLYNKLWYFGSLHDEGEQSHAMGSWIEKDKNGETSAIADGGFRPESLELTTQEFEEAQGLVHEVFSHFNYMFLHWNQVALEKVILNTVPRGDVSVSLTEL